MEINGQSRFQVQAGTGMVEEGSDIFWRLGPVAPRISTIGSMECQDGQ